MALNNVRVTRVILVSHFGEWGGKSDMHLCTYTHPYKIFVTFKSLWVHIH